jgi:beta-N-acetylhexosaminidase
MTRAVIFGCDGLTLNPEERAFFADVKPLGFILFKRNIEAPDQVCALVADLKRIAGHDHVLILIDQEGGRVRRLRPPHWPEYPPSSIFETLTDDPYLQSAYVRLGARLMAHDLYAMGINVNCAPVLDVPAAGAHDIIGDRAYGMDRETVARLGRSVCEGHLAGGVLPIIKHIPGHGRAVDDSHYQLPVVDASLEALDYHDFYPFKVNADMPLAMTAHVVYTSLDKKNCATQSKKVIGFIRKALGFDGLIICDDIGMHALSGDMATRATKSLKAGCDVVLFGNGSLKEMRTVAQATPKLNAKAKLRLKAAFARLACLVEPLDEVLARQVFDAAIKARRGPEGADPTDYVRTQA